MTARKGALWVITLSTVALGVAYLTAFLPGGPASWAPLAFILAIASLLVGFMVLGAATPGRKLGILPVVFALIWLVIAGGFILVLKLPGEGVTVVLLGGLPVRAAVVIYGIGLLPAFILPLAYAMTFDAVTLRPEDLERVRQLAASNKKDAA